MRLFQTVSEGTLPVLMDDWILPYGESMCSFAIRTRLEGDHLRFVRELRELAARPDLISKRWNNMRRFVECYWPHQDNGLSAPFVVHVARRAGRRLVRVGVFHQQQARERGLRARRKRL
jgi:hypothetical protein